MGYVWTLDQCAVQQMGEVKRGKGTSVAGGFWSFEIWTRVSLGDCQVWSRPYSSASVTLRQDREEPGALMGWCQNRHYDRPRDG